MAAPALLSAQAPAERAGLAVVHTYGFTRTSSSGEKVVVRRSLLVVTRSQRPQHQSRTAYQPAQTPRIGCACIKHIDRHRHIIIRSSP